MGMFDTKDQQEQARKMGRSSFLEKARMELAKKLIEAGAVPPIAPPTSDPADIARARREEEELLKAAEDLIYNRPAVYKGASLNEKIPAVEKEQIARILPAGDEFGKQAAASVEEKTGLMSGGFWAGLMRWVFSGFGMFGGPSFMQAQAEASAPRVAADFKTRVSTNPILKPFIDAMGPDGLAIVEREMNAGILRAGKVPGAPTEGKPPTLIGVQRKARDAGPVGPLDEGADPQKNLDAASAQFIDKTLKEIGDSIPPDAKSTKLMRAIIIKHTSTVAKDDAQRRKNGATPRTRDEFSAAVYSNAMKELKAALADPKKLEEKYKELGLGDLTPEELTKLKKELDDAANELEKNRDPLLGVMGDVLNAKDTTGKTLFDIIGAKGDAAFAAGGVAPEIRDEPEPDTGVKAPEGANKKFYSIVANGLNDREKGFGYDDMKLIFLQYSTGLSVVPTDTEANLALGSKQIEAVSIKLSNVLGDNDKEWAADVVAAKAANDPAREKALLEKMVVKIDEELKEQIKDEDLRRTVAKQIADGYVDNKWGKTVPARTKPELDIKYEKSLERMTKKILMDKINDVFKPGDPTGALLSARAGMAEEVLKDKIATAATNVQMKLPIPAGKDGFNIAAAHAYEKLVVELGKDITDDKLRFAIAESIAYEMAKAEGKKRGWTIPAPTTRHADALKADIVSSELRKKFNTTGLQAAFLKAATGELPADAAKIPEQAQAQMDKVGGKIATLLEANEKEMLAKLADIEKMKDTDVQAVEIQQKQIVTRMVQTPVQVSDGKGGFTTQMRAVRQDTEQSVRTYVPMNKAQMRTKLKENMMDKFDEALAGDVKDPELRRALIKNIMDRNFDERLKLAPGAVKVNDKYALAERRFAASIMDEMVKFDAKDPQVDAMMKGLVMWNNDKPIDFNHLAVVMKPIIAAAMNDPERQKLTDAEFNKKLDDDLQLAMVKDNAGINDPDIIRHLAPVIAAQITQGARGEAAADLNGAKKKLEERIYEKLDERIGTSLDPATNKDARVLMNAVRMENGQPFNENEVARLSKGVIVGMMKDPAAAALNEQQFKDELSKRLRAALSGKAGLTESGTNAYIDKVATTLSAMKAGKANPINVDAMVRNKIAPVVYMGVSSGLVKFTQNAGAMALPADAVVKSLLNESNLKQLITDELVRVVKEDNLTGLSQDQIDQHMKAKVGQVLLHNKDAIFNGHTTRRSYIYNPFGADAELGNVRFDVVPDWAKDAVIMEILKKVNIGSMGTPHTTLGAAPVLDEGRLGTLSASLTGTSGNRGGVSLSNV